MQITLIRHFPTEWNQHTWLQGRRDIDILPISDSDQVEMQKNLDLLRQLAPFDVVLASSLKRTHQTAELYGFQPKMETLLDELDFGPFEGRPKEELLKKHGSEWTENPRQLVLGESLCNLEQRIQSFLSNYQNYKNILLFGHGSWSRAIISYLTHGHINEMNKITVKNNQCITLKYEGWVTGTGSLSHK